MDSTVKNKVKKRVVKKVKRRIRRRLLKKVLITTLSVGFACLVAFLIILRRKKIKMIVGKEMKKTLMSFKQSRKQLNKFTELVKGRKTKADRMSVDRHF